MRTIGGSALAFTRWLAQNPIPGDLPFGTLGTRYQVTRYCDYLGANPWIRGNPLEEASARDGAVEAYRLYLGVYAPAETLERVLANLDHFYVFLGLGPVIRRQDQQDQKERVTGESQR